MNLFHDWLQASHFQSAGAFQLQSAPSERESHFFQFLAKKVVNAAIVIFLMEWAWRVRKKISAWPKNATKIFDWVFQ